MKNELIILEAEITDRIYNLRGMQVMLDSDLAILYEVSTKALNQAVKRNIARFPSDFMFQLTEEEKMKLVTNCDHLQKLKYASQLPFAFTEHGVTALSGILKSKKASEINIKIIRAFVAMRRFINKNAGIFNRIDVIEQKQLKYQVETNDKFDKVFEAIENKKIIKKQGIFFEGQIFDAYNFISNIIRSAKKSIILIDNYIDDSVLTLFSKRKKCIKVKIYTKNITKQLILDLDKYNAQYPSVSVKKLNLSHDRFLIIDGKEIYHIGASLKDLGKKWFAFSKFDANALNLLEKLK